MRDAFGGAFMIKLFLIFIVIYVSIIAVAINYAKAFRVKNGIINKVEQYQFSGNSDSSTIDEIDKYLEAVGYNFSQNTTLKNYCENQENSKDEDDNYTYTSRGACIVPRGSVEERYYKVITFIHIELPFFNISMTIPISGETEIVYIKKGRIV